MKYVLKEITNLGDAPENTASGFEVQAQGVCNSL